ncbi:hypothetical protein TIFTF001_009370 [Ficus carica]|uniref:Uncharacterized protein n=1 Tax=Ficus carica TaxID=3494 RepID=A0AA87ZV62_FICCA|nr:hypothetical protein TIFTF001_009370 [Ficus carica]
MDASKHTQPAHQPTPASPPHPPPPPQHGGHRAVTGQHDQPPLHPPQHAGHRAPTRAGGEEERKITLRTSDHKAGRSVGHRLVHLEKPPWLQDLRALIC